MKNWGKGAWAFPMSPAYYTRAGVGQDKTGCMAAPRYPGSCHQRQAIAENDRM